MAAPPARRACERRRGVVARSELAVALAVLCFAACAAVAASARPARELTQLWQLGGGGQARPSLARAQEATPRSGAPASRLPRHAQPPLLRSPAAARASATRHHREAAATLRQRRSAALQGRVALSRALFSHPCVLTPAIFPALRRSTRRLSAAPSASGARARYWEPSRTLSTALVTSDTAASLTPPQTCRVKRLRACKWAARRRTRRAARQRRLLRWRPRSPRRRRLRRRPLRRQRLLRGRPRARRRWQAPLTASWRRSSRRRHKRACPSSLSCFSTDRESLRCGAWR